MLVFFTNGDLLHNLYYVNLWILNNPPAYESYAPDGNNQ